MTNLEVLEKVFKLLVSGAINPDSKVFIKEGTAKKFVEQGTVSSCFSRLETLNPKNNDYGTNTLTYRKGSIYLSCDPF